MHRVRVGVVCAMLDDIRDADGGHLFIVKGGTAMQFRFGIHARATTDLDVVFRGRATAWLDVFDAAVADHSWNGFSVARKANPVQIEIAGLGYRPWRVPLQLRYEGRDFGSIVFEVAIDEVSADHHELIEPDDIQLSSFALDPPRYVPCLDIPYQIAQKIHACTEPIEGGNDRVRDIIDVWLLEELLGVSDLRAIRAAAVDTFHRRGRHEWPPTVTPSDSWAGDYTLLVAEYPDAPPSIDAAIDYLSGLISRIDAGTRYSQNPD